MTALKQFMCMSRFMLEPQGAVLVECIPATVWTGVGPNVIG